MSAGFQQRQLGQDAGKCCAYNRTRERFISTEVEYADFAASSLELRLAALVPGSGAALWLVPFRGLSPTSVRVPIDLLYLDQDSVVQAAVESFPIAHVPDAIPPAATVLALPAHAIASAGIQPGDRLLLCAHDEMESRLAQWTTAWADTPIKQNTAADNVLPWVERARADQAEPDRPAPGQPALDRSGLAVPAPSPSGLDSKAMDGTNPGSWPSHGPLFGDPDPKPAKPSKNWLQRAGARRTRATAQGAA